MPVQFAQLTAEQKKTLNDMSQQRDPDVKLGDLIDALITAVVGA